MVKLFLLVAVIVTALLLTTLLNRPSQVVWLKVFLVFFLSLLSGWLCLRFLAVKVVGLYDEYVLNLYRLKIDRMSNLPKPPPGSLDYGIWSSRVDHSVVPRNIYLKKFEAVYGTSGVPKSRRFMDNEDDSRYSSKPRSPERIQGDAFSPVVMMTTLLCVVWMGFLQPELYLGWDVPGNVSLSGLPRMPEDALRYGFLGSYTCSSYKATFDAIFYSISKLRRTLADCSELA